MGKKFARFKIETQLFFYNKRCCFSDLSNLHLNNASEANQPASESDEAHKENILEQLSDVFSHGGDVNLSTDLSGHDIMPQPLSPQKNNQPLLDSLGKGKCNDKILTLLLRFEAIKHCDLGSFVDPGSRTF